MNKFMSVHNKKIICEAEYYRVGLEDGFMNKTTGNYVKKENYDVLEEIMDKIISNGGFYNEWMPFIYVFDKIVPVSSDDIIVNLRGHKSTFSEEEFYKHFNAY